MTKNIPPNRAGKYRQVSELELGNYFAFSPNPLPPNPNIEISMKLLTLLSQADSALARLDGITELLPDADFFTLMYVRRESASSSQIEGTQATFSDAIDAEAGRQEVTSDVPEILNHIKAMNEGLRRVRQDKFPLTQRLIRDLHRILLQDVRGGSETKRPGEFRTRQNWIGGPTINTATYIPPHVSDMQLALDALEKFIHDNQPMPALMKIGLIHSQFETIHPFKDGNGRMGRLLITLFLCDTGILKKPMLYISEYFRVYRSEYYRRLHEVHERGEFDNWLLFFLEAVAKTAEEATDTARKVVSLKEDYMNRISHWGKGAKSANILLHKLFSDPMVNIKFVEELTGLSTPSANTLVNKFIKEGMLKQVGTQKRNRWFRFYEYVNLFKERESF